MARYTQDVVLNKPNDFVFFMMNDWLQKNSFKQSEWKGESAFRRGDGMIEGFRFLKWNYDGSAIHIQAWMKGPFGGEQSLDGFWGWAVKASYKNELNELITLLQQEIPQPGAAVTNEDGTVSQAPQNVIPVKTADNKNAAVLSLVFGILAIVLSFSYFGLIFGCLGIVFYRSGKGSSKAGMAKAGMICSIVGFVLFALMFIAGFLIGFLSALS